MHASASVKSPENEDSPAHPTERKDVTKLSIWRDRLLEVGGDTGDLLQPSYLLQPSSFILHYCLEIYGLFFVFRFSCFPLTPILSWTETNYSPFEFVIRPSGEGGWFQNFSHFLSAEAEIIDGPHIAEADDFHLDNHNNN